MDKKLLIAHAATQHEAWMKLRDEIIDLRQCGWSFGNICDEKFDSKTNQWTVKSEMLYEDKG